MKITGSENLGAVFHMGYLPKKKQRKQGELGFQGTERWSKLEALNQKQRTDINTVKMQKNRCIVVTLIKEKKY